MYPIIFETSFFTLYTVWLLFAFAIIVTIYTLIKLSVQNGLKLQFINEHSVKLFVWTLIGARLGNIIFHYQTYFYEFTPNTFFRLFYIWDNGLSIWGGILALIICFYKLCKKNDQDFWKWLDVIVPATLLGLAISHLGAFFEGSNYGSPTNLPWGVNFESMSIKYTVPIHPTQIYSALYSSFIFFGIILLGHHEKIKNLSKSGFPGLLGILIYSIFRFLEEFVRGDDIITVFNIRISQILVSIILIYTGIILYLRYNMRQEKA